MPGKCKWWLNDQINYVRVELRCLRHLRFPSYSASHWHVIFHLVSFILICHQRPFTSSAIAWEDSSNSRWEPDFKLIISVPLSLVIWSVYAHLKRSSDLYWLKPLLNPSCCCKTCACEWFSYESQLKDSLYITKDGLFRQALWCPKNSTLLVQSC